MSQFVSSVTCHFVAVSGCGDCEGDASENSERGQEEVSRVIRRYYKGHTLHYRTRQYCAQHATCPPIEL